MPPRAPVLQHSHVIHGDGFGLDCSVHPEANYSPLRAGGDLSGSHILTHTHTHTHTHVQPDAPDAAVIQERDHVFAALVERHGLPEVRAAGQGAGPAMLSVTLKSMAADSAHKVLIVVFLFISAAQGVNCSGCFLFILSAQHKDTKPLSN